MFLRRISELPEWSPTVIPNLDMAALQEEGNLQRFLSDTHLSEYGEEFRVFASCQEWWCQLPLFTDEEMRIWFGMDKPGHLIRFRTALREVSTHQVNESVKQQQKQQVISGNRTDMSVPQDLLKRSRSQAEDEILVLFQGALATLTISAQDIRIVVDEADLHRHSLKELLCVYQDGEDLTRFGYQLVDSSSWQFQTASIVTTARAVLVIAHRFGFQ